MKSAGTLLRAPSLLRPQLRRVPHDFRASKDGALSPLSVISYPRNIGRSHGETHGTDGETSPRATRRPRALPSVGHRICRLRRSRRGAPHGRGRNHMSSKVVTFIAGAGILLLFLQIPARLQAQVGSVVLSGIV